MTPLGALELFAIGVAASIFGSIVGLGGGFVIIPVLRVAFGVPPAQVAGTSLLMVLANTGASTFGYLRARVVDLRLAMPFTLGAVPGSIIGVFAVKRFSAERIRHRVRRRADRARGARPAAPFDHLAPGGRTHVRARSARRL